MVTIPGEEFFVVEVGASHACVSSDGVVVKVDVIELAAGVCADGATNVRLVTGDIGFEFGVLSSGMLVIGFGGKLVFDSLGSGEALLVAGATMEDRAVERFGVFVGGLSSIVSDGPSMNSADVNIFGGSISNIVVEVVVGINLVSVEPGRVTTVITVSVKQAVLFLVNDDDSLASGIGWAVERASCRLAPVVVLMQSEQCIVSLGNTVTLSR